MARNIVLVRHGSVEERYAGKLVGSTNAALSPAGISQCKLMAPFIYSFENAHYVASPMKRCLQSAEAAGINSEELHIINDIREADFGDWEDISFKDIAKRDPEATAKWASFDPEFSFPGGESISGFMKRVQNAADAITEIENDTVVAFTHGGVIRFMLCWLLDLDFRKYVVFDVKYADVFVLKVHGKKAVLSAMINHPVTEAGEGL